MEEKIQVVEVELEHTIRQIIVVAMEALEL